MNKNVYQRQVWVDLPIPSHLCQECRTSFNTLLQTARGTGQYLIAGEVYNHPISPRSKIPLPQCALAFDGALHAISQVFREMLS